MKYQVYENDRPCGELAKLIRLDESWYNDTFPCPVYAEFYASAWACGTISGPRELMWAKLRMLPFEMELNKPQYINGVFMTIKGIEE